MAGFPVWSLSLEARTALRFGQREGLDWEGMLSVNHFNTKKAAPICRKSGQGENHRKGANLREMRFGFLSGVRENPFVSLCPTASK